MSSDPAGLCFVETSNIDGETNLKIKEATRTPWHRAKMSLTVEPPSEQIYSFSGRLLAGEQHCILGIANLLLRGSTLRNTEWIVGVVVYTGPETRIMRNSAATAPSKQAKLDREVNYHMTLMLLVLLGMVVFSFGWWLACLYIRRGRFSPDSAWLLAREFRPGALLLRFFTYIVLYHSIVPISLLVTLEVCRFHLSRLISSDLSFYPEEDNAVDYDHGVSVANSNIVDDLGQISFVLSDKTGTLTENRMELVRVADARGTTYDINMEQRGQCSFPADLVEAMSVCHTVMIESPQSEDADAIKSDALQYQASSPDELAIVQGMAMATGLRFVERQAGSLVLAQDSPHTPRQSYKILHLVEFTSERKRMTLVVQAPGTPDRVLVLCKGADDAILQRLQAGEDSRGVVQAVEGFAKDGLRTLVFAKREMNTATWRAWQQELMEQRRPASDLEAELESNLCLVGVSGVEDRLAEGVPESIACLQEAGMRVWILTGDRMETALNVAVSCRLHRAEQQIVVIQDRHELRTLERGVMSRPSESHALVLDGATLESILGSRDPEDKLAFMRLATACASVLCCRTSPLQKSQITELLQQHSGKLCLTIGDGANDVGMIQAAAVGVGIAGKEGRQAARASDVSVPGFSALPRLLLVHGAWSYTRLAKTIVYCSYKNLLIVTCQFWFALVCAASGQTAFETWMLTLSNALFTSWVPIVIGVTDQHVPAAWLLARPGLYKRGPRNAALTPRRFWRAAANAMLQSLALLFLVGGSLGGDPILPDGTTGGLWLFSSTYYCAALVTILLKAALLAASWNTFTAAILLFGILSWFGYLLGADLAARHWALTGSPMYHMTRALLSYRPFWLLILLAPLAVLLRDLAWKYYKRLYRPREYHIVQELDMLARRSAASISVSATALEETQLPAPAMNASTGSFTRHLNEQPEVGHGFAFSQTAGQQSLLKNK